MGQLDIGSRGVGYIMVLGDDLVKADKTGIEESCQLFWQRAYRHVDEVSIACQAVE